MSEHTRDARALASTTVKGGGGAADVDGSAGGDVPAPRAVTGRWGAACQWR